MFAVGSLVPGPVGIASAIASASSSLASGDKTGAGLSIASVVPLGGLAGKLVKAERLAANVEKGAAAEKTVEATLKAEGKEILGSQVSVRTEQGLRRVDTLAKDSKGLVNVETKSGKATRSSAQVAKDNEIAQSGGTYVGKNAPADLKGQKLKVPTEVRNPDKR
jgi:Holliday junction resolvase-like predicted endonuclease